MEEKGENIMFSNILWIHEELTPAYSDFLFFHICNLIPN
jgi:hypothetical protein